MSILKSQDGKELLVTCSCGCDSGVSIRINQDYWNASKPDNDIFAYCTILSGNWYKDQYQTIRDVLWQKMKKIWAIIRNKDYYYSEICMTRKDFETFREYINEVGEQIANH